MGRQRLKWVNKNTFSHWRMNCVELFEPKTRRSRLVWMFARNRIWCHLWLIFETKKCKYNRSNDTWIDWITMALNSHEVEDLEGKHIPCACCNRLNPIRHSFCIVNIYKSAVKRVKCTWCGTQRYFFTESKRRTLKNWNKALSPLDVTLFYIENKATVSCSNLGQCGAMILQNYFLCANALWGGGQRAINIEWTFCVESFLNATISSCYISVHQISGVYACLQLKDEPNLKGAWGNLMRWFGYAKLCNYNTESEVQYFSARKKNEHWMNKLENYANWLWCETILQTLIIIK